ncbi:MAG: hypothetical protein ABWZ25_16805 [Chitinophagaceae bacterium]
MAVTLKPWIMLMVLLMSFLLFVASLLFRDFRVHRRASALLLTICTVIFLGTYSYSKSKSFESANSVVLMISTPREIKDLHVRLNDPSLTRDSAAFIKSILSDIEIINTQYGGNPWDASQAGNLQVLNFFRNENTPAIRKAFNMMYFDHWHNTLDLATVALSRYFIKLKTGLSSLDIVYGPDIRFIRKIDFPFIFIGSLLCIIYYFRVHRKKNKTRANYTIFIFTSIIFFSGVLCAIALTLAGTDLQRVVYTAIPFQLFALTYFVFLFRVPVVDNSNRGPIDGI